LAPEINLSSWSRGGDAVDDKLGIDAVQSVVFSLAT
jgi:hypothetical protein